MGWFPMAGCWPPSAPREEAEGQFLNSHVYYDREAAACVAWAKPLVDRKELHPSRWACSSETLLIRHGAYLEEAWGNLHLRRWAWATFHLLQQT